MATEDMWAGIGEQASEKPDETLVEFVQRKTAEEDEHEDDEREREDGEREEAQRTKLIAILAENIVDSVCDEIARKVEDNLDFAEKSQLKLAHKVYKGAVKAFRSAEKKLKEHKPLIEMAELSGDSERIVERTREHLDLQRKMQDARSKMLGMREFGNELFGHDTFYYDC